MVQVSTVAYFALRIHRSDWGRADNMANPEVVTRNEEYTAGFIAGVAGQWVTKNPYIHNSFEWMSWQQGWFIGRANYMDEGWVIA